MDGLADRWMKRQMEKRRDGYTARLMDGYGWMGGWTDGWTDGQMDWLVGGWMDGWMDGWRKGEGGRKEQGREGEGRDGQLIAQME